MGKRRSRVKRADESDGDEDTLSTISSSEVSTSSTTQDEQPQQDVESIVEDHVDALYEKRSATREAGLKGLIAMLTATVMGDLVERKCETLVHQFLACIKRGSSSEAVLACRALGLLAITAGAGGASEHIFREALPHLSKLCKASSNPATRIAALESLAILTFIGGVDFSDTESAMEVFWQISAHKGNTHSEQTLGTIKPTHPVKAAALSSWTFLLSILPQQRIEEIYLPLSLPVLSSLLEAQDLGVKKASGEATAVLYEISSHASSWEEAQALDQMKALAVDSGKNKSVQRSSFRDLVSVIEAGVCKETKVRFSHGDVLKVSDWIRTVQLNTLRHFLAEGFQKHMQENSLMHEIFGFTPSSMKRASKEKTIEAKRQLIAVSKQRDLERRKLSDQVGRHRSAGIAED